MGYSSTLSSSWLDTLIELDTKINQSTGNKKFNKKFVERELLGQIVGKVMRVKFFFRVENNCIKTKVYDLAS